MEITNPLDFGLGRLAAEDPQDSLFRLSTTQPEEPSTRIFRYWDPSGAWLNQGATSSCVGHAWAHWLEDGPVRQPRFSSDPFMIYAEAQKIDEWPGESYDGTSVRAGAKVLMNLGLIAEYRWAWDLNTAIQALLEQGPLVVGTWWYESMFYPDKNGRVEIKGRAIGGHAYVANGVNTKYKVVRFKNSWGREWGDKGFFYMSFDNFARLIGEYGEVCMAVERKAA